MATKDTFEKNLYSFYREIVVKDCYMMKRWKCDFFDYIIDIGANVGVFVNYAHMRHPESKIFAYEPCKETFNYLSEKMFMKNVICINEALGDGTPLIFNDTGYSGCNQFFKEGETDLVQNYTVPSTSLSDIFEQNKIPLESNYYIKIDCEGGERFLLNDNRSIAVMKSSCACGIEVHFPPEGKNKRKSHEKRFEIFPAWNVYNTWMYDNFLSTHEIIYHCSSARMGNGIYVLLKRKK